jgi:hypothetical protein
MSALTQPVGPGLAPNSGSSLLSAPLPRRIPFSLSNTVLTPTHTYYEHAGLQPQPSDLGPPSLFRACLRSSARRLLNAGCLFRRFNWGYFCQPEPNAGSPVLYHRREGRHLAWIVSMVRRFTTRRGPKGLQRDYYPAWKQRTPKTSADSADLDSCNCLQPTTQFQTKMSEPFFFHETSFQTFFAF